MNNKEKGLMLIPKYSQYMEYIINLILKLPRTEKFNIGNEIKADVSVAFCKCQAKKLKKIENKKFIKSGK